MAAPTTPLKRRGPSCQTADGAKTRKTPSAFPGKSTAGAPPTNRQRCPRPWREIRRRSLQRAPLGLNEKKLAMAAPTTSQERRGPPIQEAHEDLSRETSCAVPRKKSTDAAPTTSQKRCGRPWGETHRRAVPNAPVSLKAMPSQPARQRRPQDCGRLQRSGMWDQKTWLFGKNSGG